MTPVIAVTVRVPAKVNLQLAVGPRQPDGYHELATVFHAVSLFDEVTVVPADRDSVVISGEGAGTVPVNASNLAFRAACALAEATGLLRNGTPPVSIRISKRIPVAAGLAGGSADAAATLVACNELWRTGLGQTELCEIAAHIGSDVPFALGGGTAIGTGRGDRVTPALAVGPFHWVLAFAHGGLPTADVYTVCDRLRAKGALTLAPPVPDQALMAALRSGDPASLGPLLSNDLQPAAISLRPGLRQALAAGLELGALGAIVSGSGPTCAYLAKDARHARNLAAALTGAGVCRAVVAVMGPAPGATVVSIAPGQP